MDKDKFFSTFIPPRKNLNDIQELINKYGPDTTLKEVLDKVNESSPYRFLKYRCPKCSGLGYTVKEYNAYPSGLPDSGWVYEAGYDYDICNLCKGMGWTAREYKPKIKTTIVGYE